MTAIRRIFKQVDVFTSVAYRGNPVAVVLDAEGLTNTQMQSVASWTHLSETTFVVPASQPTADFRLRIFSPVAELPFAGHPMLGTAHALLEAQRVMPHEGRLVAQCELGLVHLAAHDAAGRIFLEMPSARLLPLDGTDRATLGQTLGTAAVGEAAIVDLGPRWLTTELADSEAVLALEPNLSGIAELSRRIPVTGITVFGRAARHIEVRSFAPAHGISEDPVCGSGNGAVAALLLRRHQTLSYTARQGRCLGRDGYIFVELSHTEPIRLGGHAVTCIDGHIDI